MNWENKKNNITGSYTQITVPPFEKNNTLYSRSKSSIFIKIAVLLLSGSMPQPDKSLFVCRSSPFDSLDPYNLLSIVNLEKDTQIAHTETMHVLEFPLQLLDMPI